jgi:MFS family permease
VTPGGTPLRLLLAAAMTNLALGTLFAWSILLRPLRAEFGVELSALTGVFSASLVLFALVVLLGGRLTDTHSPRALTLAAAVLAGCGLALTAAAPSPPVVAVAYGGLFGLASGLGYVTVVTVASTRFGARRGLALGVVVGAYAAGPILVGPLGALAIEAAGWRATVAGLAVVVAGATALAALGLPSAPAARAPAAPAARAAAGAAAGSPGRGLLWLWLLFLTSTAPALLAFASTTEIALERGVGSGAAGVAVAALGAGNLAGRLLAGPVSDRLGTVRTSALTLLALLLALVALGWTGSAGVLLVALAVLGAEYGAISALLPAATADLVGPERFGTSYGRAFTSWGVAGVLGPAAGSWLHGVTGGYRPAFQLSIAFALIALGALAAFARHLR